MNQATGCQPGGHCMAAVVAMHALLIANTTSGAVRRHHRTPPMAPASSTGTTPPAAPSPGPIAPPTVSALTPRASARSTRRCRHAAGRSSPIGPA